MPEINIEVKASFEAISDKLSELAKKLASHASAEQAMLQSGHDLGADPSAPAGTSANFFELLASANEMNEQLQVAINDLGKPLVSIDTMEMRGEHSEVPSSGRESLPREQLESGRKAELGEDVASKADQQIGPWHDRVLEAVKSTSVSIKALEDNISTLQRTQNDIGSNVGNVMSKTESISRSTASIYTLNIEVSAAKDELVAARKDMAELPKFGNERSNAQLTPVEAIIGIILAIAGTYSIGYILLVALKTSGLWDSFTQFLLT